MPSNPAAPAPSSDATLAAAPEFVAFDHVWDDAEWRAAAAAPAGARTEAQQYLYAGGPRPHPWGAAAFIGYLADGRRAYFPSQAAFAAYGQGQGAPQPPQPGQAALASINAGLAAAGTAATAQAANVATPAERLESAAPNLPAVARPSE